MVDKHIHLKVASRVVICANNNDEGYRNGQMGVVEEIGDDEVVVKLDSGETRSILPHTWESHSYSNLMGSVTKHKTGQFKQIPLRLGNAVSTHKIQGLTLDSANINLGARSFAEHQTFVALSRVKDLRDITLTRPIRYEDIKVDQKVVEFYKKIEEIGKC